MLPLQVSLEPAIAQRREEEDSRVIGHELWARPCAFCHYRSPYFATYSVHFFAQISEGK